MRPVTDAGHWVELSCRGARLGGGFLVTPEYAVTAFHCIRGIDADRDLLDVALSGEAVVPGRVREHSSGADLVLIDILEPPDHGTVAFPGLDRAVAGEPWSAPYRPGDSDPRLAGTVMSESMTYRCERGSLIEALQLGCTAHLSEYSGYSGGPVQRDAPGKDEAVLGMMLEQYPDRQDPERYSNVLFAATVSEVLRAFSTFEAINLVNMLTADHAKPRDSSSGKAVPGSAPIGRSASRPVLRSRTARTEYLLTTLDEWGKRGLVDPMAVPGLQRDVIQRLIDSDWADENE